jgi:hypothetical protein
MTIKIILANIVWFIFWAVGVWFVRNLFRNRIRRARLFAEHIEVPIIILLVSIVGILIFGPDGRNAGIAWIAGFMVGYYFSM